VSKFLLRSMADESIEKREDEIRIIEEPVEEVVRLDVSKIDPLEKKGKIASDVLTSRGEGAPQDSAEKGVFDPETDWLEDEEETGKLAVPVGWFVLLGAGLLGILVWVIFQTRSNRDDTGDLEAGLQGIGESGSTGTKAAARGVKLAEAEKHFAEMERVITNFLAAKTVEEKVKFVRHPERILPLMKGYYERHQLEPLTFKETSEYHIASLEQRPFMALKVEVEEGEGVAVLVEDLPDGMLVDWESYVCYEPITPEKYVEEKPTKPYSFRVYAQKDYFHAYEFSDESKFECYRLTFRDSETILYGYVQRGEVTDQKFREIFPDGQVKMKIPMILKVRFLEGGKATRSVLIEDLESKLWAFANNPDEVTPSDEVK